MIFKNLLFEVINMSRLFIRTVDNISIKSCHGFQFQVWHIFHTVTLISPDTGGLLIQRKPLLF